MDRQTSKVIRFSAAGLLLLAYMLSNRFSANIKRGVEASFFAAHPDTAYVERVVDGDTVKLANGERLRYIGIDTPELKHPNRKISEMARIAKKINESLAQGKEVKIVYDVEKRDKYDRLLGYVFLKDGTFVNAELVKEGYALIMTIPPNVKYADYFLKLQEEARNTKKGFWSYEDVDFKDMRKGYRR
ncbi:MAG: nuclease [Candidatus Omnitrophica bacterium CG07_land_8_20_14_0_80_42_15]|uniref:Nuclease n=1 Tax=Candidatus Aquitaenariimonas noxiae TaxID=1974741 RepID=A0A2J0KRD8_9BACT|nr:MAG: nuclease [Candidatus Omnitrophica bacterium CG07_land_8_20_14_0_80_42_15]